MLLQVALPSTRYESYNARPVGSEPASGIRTGQRGPNQRTSGHAGDWQVIKSVCLSDALWLDVPVAIGCDGGLHRHVRPTCEGAHGWRKGRETPQAERPEGSKGEARALCRGCRVNADSTAHAQRVCDKWWGGRSRELLYPHCPNLSVLSRLPPMWRLARKSGTGSAPGI